MISEVGILTTDLARSIAFWEVCLAIPRTTHANPEPLPSEVSEACAVHSVRVSESVVLPSATAIGRVRLIETAAADLRQRSTERRPWGWRAIEVMVHDLDSTFEAARKLAREVLGQPRWLGGDPGVGIRAGQLVGPAGEIVYLTELHRDVLTLEIAQQREHGSVFIMVMGVKDIDATVDQYTRQGHTLVSRSSPLISSLNLLQNTPNRLTPSALISAGSGCYFEVNEYAGEESGGSLEASSQGPIAYVRITETRAPSNRQDEDAQPSMTPVRRVGRNSEVLLVDSPTTPSICATSHSQ